MDTENQTSRPCVSTSLTSYEPAKLRVLLTDRLTFPEAIETVGKLLSRFPNGTPANAKGYIGGLAEVLTFYPKSIAERCHEPLTGVPRDTEFLPTPAALIAWLERETAEMRRPVDREDHQARLRREARDRAAEDSRLVADRSQRLSYEELQAKHGPGWGIKGTHARERVKTKAEYQQELIAQIGRAAFDALPDIGYDWTKLPAAAVIPEAPKTDWVEDEWPPGPPPPRAPL